MTTPTAAAGASSLNASANSPRGRFLWHELHCTDAGAAVRFYPDVMSWKSTSMVASEGMPPYHMFEVAGMPVAGVMPFPDSVPAEARKTQWLPYIGTENVDATLETAVGLGAAVQLPAVDLPTIGRIAVLTDPQGAFFALYAPTSATHPEGAPRTGEMSWHDLATTDPVAALDFYARLFDWKMTEAMDMGPNGTYQMFGRDVFTYGGMYKAEADTPQPQWTTYVQVAKIDVAAEAVRQKGGTVVRGPHEVPGGDRIVVCRDNQGALFAMHGKAG